MYFNLYVLYFIIHFFYLQYKYNYYKMKFEVINPVIVGRMQVTYDENSAPDAAKKFWNELSKIIVNDIPKTCITLKDENDKLYHYKITEQKSGKFLADFMISPVDKINKDAEKSLVPTHDKITAQTQKGGRKHRYDDSPSDSSSSSSSDSIDEAIEKFNLINATRKKSPVVYYYYNPAVYEKENLFIPVFTYPIIPHYMEIGSFSTAFWG
jgi:hypothetical protein